MFIRKRPKSDELERLLAERSAALAESEQRFRDFAAAAADWLWQTDAQHRLTSIAGERNEAAGIHPPDVLGKTRWQLAAGDPQTDELWRRHKSDLDAHRPFRRFRYSFVTALGRRMHFCVSGTPVFDRNGAFSGYRGTATDETAVVEALRRAEEAEALLRDAIESVSDGFVIYDRDDRYVMCNAAHKRLHPGLAELFVPGARFEDILRAGVAKGLYAGTRGREEEWIEERLARHRDPKGFVEQPLSDGTFLVISERRMSNGGTAGVRIDVTALKRAEAARREKEEQLLSIAENVPGAIFRRVLRPDGSFTYTYVSPRMRDLYGIDPAEMLRDGAHFVRSIHPEDRGRFREALAQSAKELSPMVAELRLFTPDGQTRWLRTLSRPRKLDNGDVQWDGIALDITELKDAEAHRDRLAYYDQLTGLPNQTLFEDRLAQALPLAKRAKGAVAVICVELVSLKDLRDSRGMTVADRAIREAGRRLRNMLRVEDTAAYVGGDRFFILLTGLARGEDARNPASKIVQALEGKLEVDGDELPVKLALGVSIGPEDGDRSETLIRNAATALNEAKANPGQQYRFYDIRMTESAVLRQSLEAELRGAIERQEFALFYQPQVDTRSLRIVGAEALVRWRHPARGLVLPGEFIPIAEETGLIAPLGDFVLRRACAQTRLWHDAGIADLRVSVNLSGWQLLQEGFASTVLAILGETGLAPGSLKLELTESTIARNVAIASRVMRELAEAGLQFAIDDFGVEHSVLSQLALLPFDTIKIARLFISRMTADQAHGALVQAMISMSHAMSKDTVAVGVETHRQLTYLQALQCDSLQGFIFHEPVPADAFLPMLRRGVLRPPDKAS
jgi:diguanylate cyclase (GGDEF)-like protein/PAS domain S-box-containing protein